MTEKQQLIDTILSEYLDSAINGTNLKEILQKYLPQESTYESGYQKELESIHEDMLAIPINCLDEVKYQDEFREIRTRIGNLLSPTDTK